MISARANTSLFLLLLLLSTFFSLLATCSSPLVSLTTSGLLLWRLDLVSDNNPVGDTGHANRLTETMGQYLKAAPESVIAPDGRVNLGTFQGRIANWNLADARNIILPPLFRRLASKLPSWNIVIVDREVVIGIFVSNRGYYCSAQVFCHDLKTGRMVEHCVTLPFTTGMSQNQRTSRFVFPGMRIYLEKQQIEQAGVKTESNRNESQRLHVIAGHREDRIALDAIIHTPSTPIQPITIVEQQINPMVKSLHPLRVVQYDAGLTAHCSLELGEHRFSLNNCTTFFWKEFSVHPLSRPSQQLFFSGYIPTHLSTQSDPQEERLWGLVLLSKKNGLYSGKCYLWQKQHPFLAASSMQIGWPMHPGSTTPFRGNGLERNVLSMEFTPWGDRSTRCHTIGLPGVFKDRNRQIYGAIEGRGIVDAERKIQSVITGGEGFINLI